MTTFLFWNLGRRALGHILVNLALRNDVDVILLVECQETAAEILLALNGSDEPEYYYAPGNDGCNHVEVFTRFSGQFTKTVAEAARSSIRHLVLPGLTDILVAVAHLPSKYHSDPNSQIGHCTELAQLITEAERDVGHRRTILVGDLNVNPFEPGVVLASGLHGVMSRSTAERQQRVIQGKPYPFFYNPMWGLFGDRTAGPPGTYYYDSSDFNEFFWHMFDQVLIRPDLLDRFRNESLQILTSDGQVSLLGESGRPNGKVGSDHLPILFTLTLYFPC